LGGRLDATNIIDSDISIITSIGIDHTEFLGDTIDSIALEKAGVMRPFKKCIFAQENPPSVLYKYSKNKSVNLLTHNNDYTVNRYSDSWSIVSKSMEIHDIPNLKMIGDYQYNYAAASVIALNDILPEALSNQELLKNALCDTMIPGRFQYLQHSPDIILDVAHNEDAAKSLATNIKRLGYKNIHVVLGILADKDVYSIVKPFSLLVDHWHIGTISSERGMNAEEIKFRIKSLFKNKFSIETYNSISAAYHGAINQQDDNTLILVYGSFYTVSEALQSNSYILNKEDAI
jgi:dihydrofolate synthase/folylpolyglutamate synthase